MAKSGAGRAFSGAGLAILLVVAGALVGGWAAKLVPPTDADVRSAARSLVPVGSTVTEATAFKRGGFPAEGPYEAGLRIVDPQSRDQRIQAYRSQAERAGWRLIHSETVANAEELKWERDGLSAAMNIQFEPPNTEISARRIDDSRRTPILVCASVGACAGLGLWALVRLLVRRRISRA